MEKEVIEDLQIYVEILSKKLNSTEVLVSLLNSNIITTSKYLAQLQKYVLELNKRHNL